MAASMPPATGRGGDPPLFNRQNRRLSADRVQERWTAENAAKIESPRPRNA